MLKKILKNFLSKHELFSYIFCGILVGAVSFILIYGVSVLNPTNVDWIYQKNGDLFQHQIGWEFFRNAPWKFPFGLYNTYPYPFNNSIIYTDSIPLFAIFFKLFRFWLPENFQYLGIFSIICFMLLGLFTSLILRKLKINLILSLCILPLFFFNSILLFRIFWHTSLGGGQFLILATILVWLYRKELSLKYKLIFYGLLSFISLFIHAYFFPMIYCFIISDILNDYIIYKNKERTVYLFLIPILSFLFAAYLLGTFHTNAILDIGGITTYSMNLNAFFNSMGNSVYVKALPRNDGQYEGMMYLGISFFILIILSVLKFNFKFKNIIKKNKVFIKTVSIIILPLFIYALSPKITFGQKIILDYSLYISKQLIYIMNIFRSTGRFAWPIYYMLLIGLIYYLYNNETKKIRLGFIFIICSIIAYFEIVPNTAIKINYIGKKYDNNFCKQLSNVLDNNIKHIMLFSNEIYKDYSMPAMFAAKYKLTLNTGYFARQLDNVEEYTQQIEKKLIDGNIDNDTIYIFSKNNFLNFTKSIKTNLNKFNNVTIENYNVIYSK